MGHKLIQNLFWQFRIRNKTVKFILGLRSNLNVFIFFCRETGYEIKTINVDYAVEVLLQLDKHVYGGGEIVRCSAFLISTI